jgi:hypothetical protein
MGAPAVQTGMGRMVDSVASRLGASRLLRADHDEGSKLGDQCRTDSPHRLQLLHRLKSASRITYGQNGGRLDLPNPGQSDKLFGGRPVQVERGLATLGTGIRRSREHHQPEKQKCEHVPD